MSMVESLKRLPLLIPFHDKEIADGLDSPAIKFLRSFHSQAIA